MQQVTLIQAFVNHVKAQPDEPFLFYKQIGEWREVSWREVGEKVRSMALGLQALGVEKGDRISPISTTIPDMAYCCMATAACGAIYAAIYHTNSPKECAHVINDARARIAFAEDQTQLAKLKTVWRDCPTLERIIVFRMQGTDDDRRIMTLDALIELGKRESEGAGRDRYYERIELGRPEDAVAIIYTSGTTGAPRGAVFTHAGIIRNLTEQAKYFPISKSEKGIGYLPMAHAIELMDGHWRHVFFGFPHVYAESLQTLFDDVRQTEPTFFFTTPRFYEKHYNELMARIDKSPLWKKKLMKWCLETGSKYQDMKEDSRKSASSAMLSIMNSVASLIYFRKVRAAVDKKLRWASSGAAPIPARILHFFRSCGMPIYEGFGLTESQGLICLNRPGAWKIGTVGKPMDGVEVAFSEEGELLVKGWTRCAGYWNNPEATEELFHEGWLHTGDLGYLDEDGFMHVTGRKKEIIITSTGKNIAPLALQNLLKTSPYISEAVVFGEGKTFLTALVTLNEEKVIQCLKDRNPARAEFSDLFRDPDVVDLIGKEIETRNQELANIERIKKFTILESHFRQDCDELTPTMKVKRKVVEQRYKNEIEAMYT
jgi:long-chain acyl-CoA synthetase